MSHACMPSFCFVNHETFPRRRTIPLFRDSSRRAKAWRPVRQWREGPEGAPNGTLTSARTRATPGARDRAGGRTPQADTLRRASPRSPRGAGRRAWGTTQGAAAPQAVSRRRDATGERRSGVERKVGQRAAQSGRQGGTIFSSASRISRPDPLRSVPSLRARRRPSDASGLPGVTPNPLLARRCLGLSCAVLSHVTRQPSPLALAAHRTPPRWPVTWDRDENQAARIPDHHAGRQAVNGDP
jgi:hypothetical protein